MVQEYTQEKNLGYLHLRWEDEIKISEMNSRIEQRIVRWNLKIDR